MKSIVYTLLLLSTYFNVVAQTPFQFEWAKQMVGKTSSTPSQIAIDKAGNVYTIGYLSDTVDFDPGPAEYKLYSNAPALFISKLDKTGAFVWTKLFNSATTHKATSGIALDSAGNIYVTGDFSDSADFDPDPLVNRTIHSNGSSDIYILKLSPSGNLIWVNTFGGLSGDEKGFIHVDKNYNVYVSGLFRGLVDFDPSATSQYLDSTLYADAFLCRFDSSGNFKYAKTFKSSGPVYSCLIEDVHTDDESSILIGGSLQNSVDMDPGPAVNILTGSDYDAFVAKLDSAGNFLWANNWGGTAQDDCWALTTDSKHNIYLTGHVNAPTSDLDPGAGTSILAMGSFTMKLNSNGKFIWAKGGLKYTLTYSLAITGDSKLYTAGTIISSEDMDPGPGVFKLTSKGGNDGFISISDEDGNFKTAVSFGGTGHEYLTGMAIRENDEIHLTGTFQDTVDFDPGAGKYDLTCSTGPVLGDIYVYKMKVCLVETEILQADNILYAKGSGYSYQWVLCPGYTPIPGANGNSYLATSNGSYALIISNSNCVDTSDCVEITGLGLNEFAKTSSSHIYPNPSGGVFTIDVAAEMTGGTAMMYNTLGQKVNTVQLKNQQTTTELPAGLYFIKIEKGQRVEMLKVLVL